MNRHQLQSALSLLDQLAEGHKAQRDTTKQKREAIVSKAFNHRPVTSVFNDSFYIHCTSAQDAKDTKDTAKFMGYVNVITCYNLDPKMPNHTFTVAVSNHESLLLSDMSRQLYEQLLPLIDAVRKNMIFVYSSLPIFSAYFDNKVTAEAFEHSLNVYFQNAGTADKTTGRQPQIFIQRHGLDCWMVTTNIRLNSHSKKGR